MKRILCMILFLLMLLSLGSCANTKEEPSNTEGGTGQAATEAETDFFPDIEKKDYKDETFRMIGWQSANSWYYSESYSGDASDGQSIRNDFSNLF